MSKLDDYEFCYCIDNELERMPVPKGLVLCAYVDTESADVNDICDEMIKHIAFLHGSKITVYWRHRWLEGKDARWVPSAIKSK